jgi:hypothetical protein
MKDSYITLWAEPVTPARTRAGLSATFKARFPVISHLAAPIFVRIMSGMIKKDMAGLKELCETGKIAAAGLSRQAANASRLPSAAA